MYQGKILKEIYQINNQKFILHYENGQKESMEFDSFNITLGNRKYSISKMFHNMEGRLPIEIHKERFFFNNLNNLSLKKMEEYYTLNKDGFKRVSYKYSLKDREDYIGLSFNIKSKQQEFKILLIFNQIEVRFMPVIFVNKQINMDTVHFSKTYLYLKKYFSTKYYQKNENFSDMINHSDYLHQNSTHFFELHND